MSFASELRQVDDPPHAPHRGPSPLNVPDDNDPAPLLAAPLSTRYSFAKSFACAGAVCMVATMLVTHVATHYVPPDAIPLDRLYVMMNAMLWFTFPSAWLAVFTALIVRCSARVWPFWSIALTFLAMFLLVVVVPISGLALL